MAIPMIQLEGTREEIVERLPDFEGRRLRVEVYSDDQDAPAPLNASSNNVPDSYQLKLAKVLQQVESNACMMKPARDENEFLRKGRAGEMFGYDGE